MKKFVCITFIAAVITALLMVYRIQTTVTTEPAETQKTITNYLGEIIVITETDPVDPWVPPIVEIYPSVNPASYSDVRAPLYSPPSSSENARDFFSDAAFLGDSITVMLKAHNELTGVLGDAAFIAKEGYGMGHAVSGTMYPEYNGTQMAPEKALALSGAKKVFIMLGANDIGVYGVDGTIEKWEIMIPKIRKACPGIQIYIQSCTPIWTGGEVELLNNYNIDKLNSRLKEFAANNNCCFINTSPYMKDSTGGLPNIYASDSYVHLTNAGADAWAKLLLAYADALA